MVTLDFRRIFVYFTQSFKGSFLSTFCLRRGNASNTGSSIPEHSLNAGWWECPLPKMPALAHPEFRAEFRVQPKLNQLLQSPALGVLRNAPNPAQVDFPWARHGAGARTGPAKTPGLPWEAKTWIINDGYKWALHSAEGISVRKGGAGALGRGTDRAESKGAFRGEHAERNNSGITRRSECCTK